MLVQSVSVNQPRSTTSIDFTRLVPSRKLRHATGRRQSTQVHTTPHHHRWHLPLNPTMASLFRSTRDQSGTWEAFQALRLSVVASRRRPRNHGPHSPAATNCLSHHRSTIFYANTTGNACSLGRCTGSRNNFSFYGANSLLRKRDGNPSCPTSKAVLRVSSRSNKPQPCPVKP